MIIRRCTRLVMLALGSAALLFGGSSAGHAAYAAQQDAPAIGGDATGPAEGAWSWPVAAPHPVTRPFDVTGPYDPGHRGIDLDAPPGSAVAAPAAGIVRFAGVVVDRPVLSIAHDDGSISSFEPVDALVAQGERVERGQLVAALSTTVTHAPAGGLHLGARVGDAYLNPLFLLGELPPSVLLPLGETATP